MADLKLIALDAEDLAVISAHLQDAVLKVATSPICRARSASPPFPTASTGPTPSATAPKSFARRRTALRFERVLAAQVQGIDLKNKSLVLALLAIGFEPHEAPEGDVTLLFADGGAIRLRVECIEAELKDLGAAWQAKSKPQHPDDPSGMQGT